MLVNSHPSNALVSLDVENYSQIISRTLFAKVRGNLKFTCNGIVARKHDDCISLSVFHLQFPHDRWIFRRSFRVKDAQGGHQMGMVVLEKLCHVSPPNHTTRAAV